MPTGEKIYKQHDGNIYETSNPDEFLKLDRVIDFVRIESINKNFGAQGSCQKGEAILETWKKHFNTINEPWIITGNPSVKSQFGRILWKRQLVEYR